MKTNQITFRFIPACQLFIKFKCLIGDLLKKGSKKIVEDKEQSPDSNTNKESSKAAQAESNPAKTNATGGNFEGIKDNGITSDFHKNNVGRNKKSSETMQESEDYIWFWQTTR